ncbi:MAG TPA: FecR family protein [Flavitalea sp.]|nr:FecR family protein [Flavitalea sp.]
MNKKFTVEEAQELLRRYRLGQCTKEEMEIIDRWYHSFDQQEGNEMDFAGTGMLKEIKAQMFESIASRIELEENGDKKAATEKPVRKLHHFDFQALRRIAAILIVGTGVGLFFYTERDPESTDSQNFVAATPGGKTGQDISDTASKSTIYLSDGSVVWLKAGSRLEYPRKFDGEVREVTLVGEAFFDVAKDPEKPFIIHAADFTTRVLGTSFNIKAYGDDDAAEVVVVTGKVMVSAKEPSVDKSKVLVLKPNQKAIYSRKDKSLVEAPVTEQEVKITTNKSKLAFDETQLKDIINVLNATYDINIALSNESMTDCMITADLTNETLGVSIAILSKALHATYTIDGKNIMLLGNGCGVQP